MTDDRFNFVELDTATRALMLEELDYDVEVHGHLYPSKVLTDRGASDYEGLMRRAIADFDEAWLTDRLNEEDRVLETPVDAARRLARTEFNRYYIRGICRRASEHGSTVVIPYRAHDSKERRDSSSLLETVPQAAPRVLANLRGRAVHGDPESGLGKVNSGLSARCGCADCSQVQR